MIDLTLDGLMIPGLIGYTPPFGTKVSDGKGISTAQVNNNVLMAFAKMRGISISKTEETSRIEFDAKLFVTNPDITLTIGKPTYDGCSIQVHLKASGSIRVNYNSTDVLLYSKQTLKLQSTDGVFYTDYCIGIGDICIEYPGKKSPALLYPGTNWRDISDEFAGGFFRAKGGAADNTGARQADAIRNIVGRVGGINTRGPESGGCFTLTGASWAGYGWGSSEDRYVAFMDASRVVPTAEENRPINYACTIWECVAT